jgi:4-amino-4-deoxy-L-arabinose transferase-like glycosyltransferase
MATTAHTSLATRREILLAVLALVLGFGFQGSRGLYESTEGRYAEAAREMIETGDWLVPQLDYEPHWSKPPLTYWAVAGGMLALGENDWGARLAPALAYLITVWAVFALGRSMWGRSTAVAGTLVYATTPLAVLGAAAVSTDPILAMWEALAALAYWRALAARDARASGRSIVLFWLFLGLGFLTKGPPALLTLLAVLIFHGWWRATGRNALRLASLPGLLLFAGVGLGWYVVVASREQGLLAYLLRREVVDRVASARFHRNAAWYQAFLVILLPFVLGLGAWLGFVPRLWRAWRARLAGSSWPRELGRREALLFCLIWMLAPLAVLCFSKSRLPLYVLPFLPAAALVVGRGLTSTGLLDRRRSRPVIVALASAVVLLAGKGIAARIETASDIRPVAVELTRVGGGSPSVYAYELDQEYGLMFYLRGRMVRVSRDPASPWARMGLSQFLADLEDSSRSEPAYAVAHRRADELARALDQEDLAYRSSVANGYTVFSIEPLRVPGARSRPIGLKAEAPGQGRDAP